MAKRKHLGGEEALCCCEYQNEMGERSHLMACCCDCQALDMACDKCFKCEKVKSSLLQNLLLTLEDRCRLPWCSGGGAVKLKLDVGVPFLTILTSLLFATINQYCTVIALCAIPCVLLAFHRLYFSIPGNHRSRVFYVWGLFSSIVAFAVFQFIVMGFREILLWENMLLLTMFFLMLYYLYDARKDPGVIKRSQYLVDPTHDMNIHDLRSAEGHGSSQNMSWQGEQVAPVYSAKPADESRGKVCDKCEVAQLHRAGHCSICNVCIHHRDHHCVWIDACVGGDNHRSFFWALLLFVVTGLYGVNLTLTTLCTPVIYLNWFLIPNDCSYMYADFPTAISFVTAVYSLMGCLVMAGVLLYQIILISQNLTSQEAHKARQQGLMLLGVFARSNQQSLGLFMNWRNFLSGKREIMQRRHKQAILPL